ncbi:hypothetical protein L226DRAFT_201048 [Lentinus tigrinus ALCF2SS1-7]|uniref:uncharacterized protein n=1 Tax=Lentinus tigrinus ALCF2SS1-7 TaxID=1328758 RepID=UPI001165E4B8|nr:hypothetical protein L226DRAFT_201048 [Lentinus tigrinus ALCF2SS1-7]
MSNVSVRRPRSESGRAPDNFHATTDYPQTLSLSTMSRDRVAASDALCRLSRRQFPVGLAFAMSINKAQGQSVKYVGLDLRVPVFTHGQLYVALSRSTSSDHIHVPLP